MSNYIRTKNGIYDLKNDSKERIFSLHFYNEFSEKEFEKLILKQADTIEELCDEFVEEFPIYKGNDVVGIDHQKWEYSKIRNCFLNDLCEMRNYDYFIDEKYNFYGAIWTDKGLIYVAKMNEKGELELI